MDGRASAPMALCMLQKSFNPSSDNGRFLVPPKALGGSVFPPCCARITSIFASDSFNLQPRYAPFVLLPPPEAPLPDPEASFCPAEAGALLAAELEDEPPADELELDEDELPWDDELDEELLELELLDDDEPTGNPLPPSQLVPVFVPPSR